LSRKPEARLRGKGLNQEDRRMKRLIVLTGRIAAAALAVFLLFTGAQAAEKLTRIAENIYAYVDTKESSKANSFGANAGIIIGDDGIVVVDTLMSAKEGRRFLRDIRAISRKPIRYVINTHYHLDHAFGNCVLGRRGVVVAQADAAGMMEKTAAETLKHIENYGLTPEDMKGTAIVYPRLTYGDRMTIDIGGERIELIHSRRAHTGGDTLVYVPAKKVLFTGDILFTGYHPFLGEGDIEEWARALDDIKEMDVEKIVPGHGPLSAKKDLDDMREYILLFDAKAKELAAGSSDVQAVVEAIKPVLPERPEGAWLIGANIQMKYLKK
jgi:glyoxylase-like metal-dependent hydrolase (beta-lactamase superfamily II)